MARPPLSLKARAIGLLAQREQSRTELKRKLLAIERRRLAADAGDAPSMTGAEPDATDSGLNAQVDALLDALAAEGYLSEARFVESRLYQRAQRFGLQRIQQELSQHGLALDAEQQQMLRDTELGRAREVRCRRFGDDLPTERTEQARQLRFLLARGFSGDVARRALRPAE